MQMQKCGCNVRCVQCEMLAYLVAPCCVTRAVQHHQGGIARTESLQEGHVSELKHQTGIVNTEVIKRHLVSELFQDLQLGAIRQSMPFLLNLPNILTCLN